MILTETKYPDSFIAGFLEGDGTIQHFMRPDRHGYKFFRPVIRFINTDYGLLECIMEKLGKGCIYSTKPKHGQEYFTLSYDSQKRVRPITKMLSEQWLSQHRRSQLYPILQKLKIEENYATEIDIEWIKRFAAAEGYLSVVSSTYQLRKTNQKRYYDYLVFGLANTNLEVLEKIKEFLEAQGVSSFIQYSHDRPTGIKIAGIIAVDKFIDTFDVLLWEGTT